MPQWLWLAQALKRCSCDVLEELVDFLELLFIYLLPIEIVLPGFLNKNELHL
jgi:hypothetical protein